MISSETERGFTMRRAFTLAEVLAVIGIIGIVAMLTVPNLNNDADENKNIAIMKSAMGQIDAAVIKIVEKYGSIEEGLENNKSLGQLIEENMEVGKSCGNSASTCFSETGLRNNAKCNYSFIISNGVAVCVSGNDKLFIDIDGPQKGFNQYGSDKFEFTVSNDGLGFIGGNNKASHGNFVSNQDETVWAFTVGNQDYLKCPGSLKWGVTESCR